MKFKIEQRNIENEFCCLWGDIFKEDKTAQFFSFEAGRVRQSNVFLNGERLNLQYARNSIYCINVPVRKGARYTLEN